MSVLRILCTLLITASMTIPVPRLAGAAVSVEADAKNKVNLSGRQRMLIQRMAKASCFAALGVDQARHVQMAQDAHDLFESTLTALTAGDADIGLLPEKDPRIVSEMSAVEGLWPAYSAAVRGVIAAPSRETLEPVLARDMALLKAMNTAVGAFETVYGEGVLPPDLAGTINVAGRQRMLSQKVSKEFCMVAIGIDPARTPQVLAETIDLFQVSMQRLLVGDPGNGIVPPPTSELDEQMRLTAGLWMGMREGLDAAASGATELGAQAKLVAGTNDDVLAEMNRAVEMYVK